MEESKDASKDWREVSVSLCFNERDCTFVIV